MTVADAFRAAAARRILVKDGAYGTMIQAARLDDYGGNLGLAADQRGNNDLLNLTRPDVIEGICQRFADSGADLLATNTFNATSISQADYGEDAVAVVPGINLSAARPHSAVADRQGPPNPVAGRAGAPLHPLAWTGRADQRATASAAIASSRW